MNLTLPAADFVRGVNSVIACAGDSKTIPALHCVHVAWDALSGVQFVATDRYVCAEQTIPFREGETVEDFGAVSIPLDAVKNALAVIKATNPATVTVTSDGQYTPGSVAGIAFAGVGEFPKYASLFPSLDSLGSVEAFIVDPAKVAQLAGPKVKGLHSPMRIAFGASAIKPALVTRTNDEHFRGLLMPIRPATS